MKLIRFWDGAAARTGLMTERGVVETPFATMAALLAAADLDQRGLMRHGETGTARDPGAIKLLCPIDHPRNVLAIGLNYADHIAESGATKPDQQIWFNKQPSSIIGPGDAIEIPSVSAMVDWEAELVAVIGRRCRNVPADKAHQVIGGYTCGNDVSVRDWQRKTPQWMLGKSFDTHGPIGPWIVTPSAFDPRKPNAIRCFVNGERKQNSTTNQLVYDVYDQIALLSQAMTLMPGDIIFTGTPGGVGMALKPPQWLKPGDEVRVEIEGVGVLENPVVAGPNEPLGLR